MNKNDCDVLVIGAGPAGSVAARLLSKAGLNVIVVDRKSFPRRKVCGDGMTPRCTRDLYALGMGPFIRSEAFRVNHFRFHFSPSKPFLVSLDLNELYPPYSYTIRRSKLDHELLRLAREEGALVLEGNRFTGLERDGDGGWRVSLEDGGERVRDISATFLIGADGAPSSVARSLGIKTRSNGLKGIAISCLMGGVEGLDGKMDFILDREILPGAGWIFPLSPETANVGIGVLNFNRHRFKTNIKSLWTGLLHSSPSASPRLRKAEMMEEPRAGLIPFHMFEVDPVGDGFLLVGDAAGLVNPFCGEGVAFALESGWMAAAAVIGAWPRTGRERLLHYRDELRLLYKVPFARGRVFYRLTQNTAFMGAFSAAIGGKPKLDTFLCSLAYRKGASSWVRLFPDQNKIFAVPEVIPESQVPSQL